MNIQLIKGDFNAKDALELVGQMIHIKIKYHENKVNSLSNEEDIKTRESKIKHLQKELCELRQHIKSIDKNVQIEAIIKIK